MEHFWNIVTLFELLNNIGHFTEIEKIIVVRDRASGRDEH